MASSKETGSPQNHRVGEHWSGANPVPTVQHFIEHLDKEKKERDRKIDEERREKQAKAAEAKANGQEEDQSDVHTHKVREVSKYKMRNVTDPTTGKEIGVEDQDESSMEAVKDPKVNAILQSLHIAWLTCVVDGAQCQYRTTNSEFSGKRHNTTHTDCPKAHPNQS